MSSSQRRQNNCFKVRSLRLKRGASAVEVARYEEVSSLVWRAVVDALILEARQSEDYMKRID